MRKIKLPRRRRQFRIATLVWLTVVVAAFFAGPFWFTYEAQDPDSVTSIQPGKDSTDANAIRLATGSSRVVVADNDFVRMTTSNSSVVQISPVAPNMLLLRAESTGRAKVHIYDSDGKQIQYVVKVAN